MIAAETMISLGIAAIAGVAAVCDVRERRIPNWCCAAIALLALVAAWLSGGASGAALGIGVAAAALAAGVVVYALGMVGAGDAKLFAALTLWIGAERLPAFLAALALAMLLLSAWSIATRGRMPSAASRDLAALPRRATLPLGLALSTAAVAVAHLA